MIENNKRNDENNDENHDELELCRATMVAEQKRRKIRKEEQRQARKPYIHFIFVMTIMSIVLILRVCVFDINRVSGLSMYPTLNDKDLLLVEKFDTSNINRYDIITLQLDKGISGNEKPCRIIKRVYGLPGETIAIHKDGRVYINGVRLPEEYQILKGDDFPMSDEIEYEDTLGFGEYYVLGDNRDVSLDSRVYGPFTQDHITGVVSCRLKPLQAIATTQAVGKEKPECKKFSR